MKRCGRCRETLPFEKFPADATKPDGLASFCRDCRRAYHREWRTANPEAFRRIVKRYRARPEVHERQMARQRESRREKYATDENYRRGILAAQAEAYRTNGEAKRARQREYHRRHPEKTKAAAQRRRALKHGVEVEIFTSRQVFERDGWICWICGEVTEPDGLASRRPSLDHIERLADGGPHTLKNIRTAHVGCNIRREHLGKRRLHADR